MPDVTFATRPISKDSEEDLEVTFHLKENGETFSVSRLAEIPAVFAAKRGKS